MTKILFPNGAIKKPKYYNCHYKFILNIFEYLGFEIEYCPPTQLDIPRFTLQIDGETIVIDFSDHVKLNKYHENYKYYFKYHYTEGLHEQYSHIFPLGAISFLDWKQYYKLREKIHYTANGDKILNNQRVFGNAVKRRIKVRQILKEKYGNLLDLQRTNQTTYWKKANDCLVSVHVPGARNDMLDRAQHQFFAFGMCTISPKLNTYLAYKEKIIPNIHYIECKPGYADLIEKIEWCKENRDKCVQIGKNAQKLFLKTSTPDKIWEWMKCCLNQTDQFM